MKGNLKYTPAQRAGLFVIGVAAIIVGLMAFLQPNDGPGEWHGILPIVVGVLLGYNLCLLMTYFDKKK